MPTLRELRRLTADKVAPCELVRAGVEQSPGVFAGTDISTSRRRIASSELGGYDALGQGAEMPEDAYKNDWVFVLLPTGPEMRRVPEGGFHGAARAEEALTGYDPLLVPVDTPVGYLDLERPLSMVVPAGTEVEIHAFPPLRGGRSAGYHAHIQHALNVMLREDTVLVDASSATSTTLDVTAALPWLTTPAQLVSAHYEQTTAGVETWSIPGARVRFDGEKVLLSPTSGQRSGQVPLRVLRPLGSWIKPALSSVWVESAVGLLDDDDQCLGDANAISLLAAVYAAEEEAQASVVGSAAQKWWMVKASDLAARTPWLRDQRTRRPATTLAPWPDFTSVDGPFAGKWPPGGYWR